MQSTILYIKYIYKDSKKLFKLNLNNKSTSSTYIHGHVLKIPLDTNQCENLTFIIDKLLETK